MASLYLRNHKASPCTRHASSYPGVPDYKPAEYYYNIFSIALLQGQPNTPVFKVYDSFGRLATYTGPPVFVQAQSLVNLDFSSDAVGSVPVGMNLGGEPLNYWHVADAQAADMPDRLALGHHGKALWFANPNRGTTQDPSGGTPQGSILLAPMDLRQRGVDIISGPKNFPDSCELNPC